MKKTKPRPKGLWVVEMLMENGEWLPSVIARLTREEARAYVASRALEAIFDVRIRKYIRQDGAK